MEHRYKKDNTTLTGDGLRVVPGPSPSGQARPKKARRRISIVASLTLLFAAMAVPWPFYTKLFKEFGPGASQRQINAIDTGVLRTHLEDNLGNSGSPVAKLSSDNAVRAPGGQTVYATEYLYQLDNYYVTLFALPDETVVAYAIIPQKETRDTIDFYGDDIALGSVAFDEIGLFQYGSYFCGAGAHTAYAGVVGGGSNAEGAKEYAFGWSDAANARNNYAPPMEAIQGCGKVGRDAPQEYGSRFTVATKDLSQPERLKIQNLLGDIKVNFLAVSASGYSLPVAAYSMHPDFFIDFK